MMEMMELQGFEGYEDGEDIIEDIHIPKGIENIGITESDYIDYLSGSIEFFELVDMVIFELGESRQEAEDVLFDYGIV